MQNPKENMDLSQSILSLIFIISISVFIFFIIKPFIFSFSWASLLVISTWPIMLQVQNFLGGKRSLAVAVMLTTFFLFFSIPLFFLCQGLISKSIFLFHWLKASNISITEFIFLQDIPFIGKDIFKISENILDKSNVLYDIKPYILYTTTFFFMGLKNIILFIFNVLLIFFFTMILYWNGEKYSTFIRHFAKRLNPENGEDIVILSSQVIRSVASGIVMTALIQAFLSSIGILCAHMPYSIVLIMLIIFSCLIQIGSFPILVPSVIWLYWNDDFIWGTVLLVWSIIICILDNIIRPYLIQMGTNFPILLILFGAIGGLIAFGMIGLFIGPVVLIVSYRLLMLWMYNKSILS